MNNQYSNWRWRSQPLLQNAFVSNVTYKIPGILEFYIPDELPSPMIWVISRSVLSRLCKVLSVEVSCSSFSRALATALIGELSLSSFRAKWPLVSTLVISWLNWHTKSLWLAFCISLKVPSLAYGSKHFSFKWHFVWVPFGQLNCENITYKTRVRLFRLHDRRENRINTPSEKIRTYQRLLNTQYPSIYLMHF